MPSAQQEFDERYVSSTELCRILGVSRSSLVNRRAAGHLPGAIEVRSSDGKIMQLFWERIAVAPYVQAYREQLTRRGHGRV